MKIQIALVLLVVAVLGGCVTKDKAEADARAAFFAGQASAMGQMRLQNATPGAPAAAPANTGIVTILGSVKNRTVPWTENLTLVRALVAAEYVGSAELFSISVTRDGKEIPVSPQRLLNGSIDPVLEAGDVITLR